MSNTDQSLYIEQQLRERLWLGHGHGMLYGDDGEMQCCACKFKDYKRDDIWELVAQVDALRDAKMIKAFQALEKARESKKNMKPENYPTAHQLARQLLAGPDHICVLSMPVFDSPSEFRALAVTAEPVKVEGRDVVLLRPAKDEVEE